jgi:lysophospholipid acyltransferase (LPLAT)-like uncharacterized protein
MNGTAARRFTRSQRLRSWLVGWAGYLLIQIIGRTIRWQSVDISTLERIHKSGNRAIFAFWHGRIIPATYYFRHRGIVVMTSMNLDGEAIAQCIRRLGYGVARGSSSRGGLRALAEMARAVRSGRDAGFTADGPRGPRYVAKQGPVLLARMTGAAIFCFHVSVKHKIQLRSWDHFQIPLPFTPAVLIQGDPILVASHATEQDVRIAHDQVQHLLDDLRKKGDEWWNAVGR